MDYIHNNPVDAGRCTFPEGYRYSCVRLYKRNEKDGIFLTQYKEWEGCLLVWPLSLPTRNTNKGKGTIFFQPKNI
ncbi:MAG: hypothetical protein JSS93_03500 [Bacteroidetes bacterium]|nr:hypothetical protein [Bacteroidota bacterium]